VAALAITAGVTGCRSSLPKSVANAPSLSVATGLWPFAQAATVIGGDKAVVVDIVPPGTDPLTFTPDAAQARILQGSGLVLGVSGLQPGVLPAATGAHSVVDIQAHIGAANPYVWLDPNTMVRAVQAVADAMAAANPGAGSLYERNAGAYEQEVKSVGIDYSSTLSSCPGTRIIGPDQAFSTMASAYGLSFLAVGPSPTPAESAAAKTQLESGSAVAVLSQRWADNQGVEAVASASGAGVHAIDPLAGAPVTGAAGPNAYFAQMEHNLGIISGGLGCNPSEQ
jgi:zinc transport system substrate-binding protein